MRKHTKIISLILTIVMIISVFGAASVSATDISLAATGHSYTDDSGNTFIWEEEDMNAVITEIHNTTGDIVIPWWFYTEYDQYATWEIRDSAFAPEDREVPITSIDFSDMFPFAVNDFIRNQGDTLLENCPALETVIFHEICDYVFEDGAFRLKENIDRGLTYTDADGNDYTYDYTESEGIAIRSIRAMSATLVIPATLPTSYGSYAPQTISVWGIEAPDISITTIDLSQLPAETVNLFLEEDGWHLTGYWGFDDFVAGPCPDLKTILLPDNCSYYMEDGVCYSKEDGQKLFSLNAEDDKVYMTYTDANGNTFLYDDGGMYDLCLYKIQNVTDKITLPASLPFYDEESAIRDIRFSALDPDGREIQLTSIDFSQVPSYVVDSFIRLCGYSLKDSPELSEIILPADSAYYMEDGACYEKESGEQLFSLKEKNIEGLYIELSGGKLYYNIWGGKYEIVGFEGLKGDVVLPDNINGQPLPEWSELSFSDLPDVTSVTVPENFRIIFEDCENLTSVTYLGEDPYVYGGSFIDCPSISEINLPDCDSLHFEDGLLYNDDGVLYAALNKSGAYTVPDTITAIAIKAFKSCKEITGITVPDSVTKLDADSGSGYDGGAFIHLPNLKRVTLPEGLTYIPGHIFESCTALERVNIPSTVEWIGWGAFAGCRSLEKITIPSSVQSIAYWCFFDTGLKEITFLSKTEMPTIYPTAIDENVVIKGYAGSPAEEYADQNHMQFIPLSEKSGDADGDGEITSVDVTLVQRYVASIDTDIPEELLMNADVDGDGRLEIVDATWIQRYLAHIDIPYAIG